MQQDDLASRRHTPAANLRQAELVELVGRFAPNEGLNETTIAPLRLIRASAPSPQACLLYDPSVCIAVQGRKRTVVGGEAVVYDPLHYIVISVTLPVIAEVLEASPEQPYLCARIDIEPREIGRLILEAGEPDPRRVRSERGLQLAPVSDPMLDALLRLLRLLESPRDAPVLAPLALREILYRTLTGELGQLMREVAIADSRAQRIDRAVELIKERYAKPIRIEQLAEAVNMSPSSLHRAFKAVTGVTPLQFQKQLRLHEARRLMFAEGLDAATAGYQVGYESPSQFSREYRRLFGVPPRREIERLRIAAQG